ACPLRCLVLISPRRCPALFPYTTLFRSVGNGTIGALVSPLSEVVWACFPRFDGDPVSCSLLRERAGDTDFGFFDVDLIDVVKDRSEEHTSELQSRVDLVCRLLLVKKELR